MSDHVLLGPYGCRLQSAADAQTDNFCKVLFSSLTRVWCSFSTYTMSIWKHETHPHCTFANICARACVYWVKNTVDLERYGQIFKDSRTKIWHHCTCKEGVFDDEGQVFSQRSLVSPVATPCSGYIGRTPSNHIAPNCHQTETSSALESQAIYRADANQLS